MNETQKRKSIPMSDTSNQSIDLSNRRSQRRRTNVQSTMRSSSLTTTILNETTKENEQRPEDNEQKKSSAMITDKLVLSTSKDNRKFSFWTVTDRQAEWYKLTIPLNSPTPSPSPALTASSRLLTKVFERKKSSSTSQDHFEEITDTTQLIMKAIMHDLDYDMDDDDLRYLQELNQSRSSENQRLLTEEEFENAMIILEYYTAEQIRLDWKQKSCDDENIVCDICLLPDADDGNEMVFCERCNACVHQHCYGITVVPSGTWLCKPCSILRRPACLLCPKFGGPMKSTPSGTIWCHLTCALWLPELKFADYAKMEPILNLHKIPHARWTLRCVICSSSDGACVQCAQKNCRTPFHVTCGLSAGYFLDVQQTSSDECPNNRSQFTAYCQKHSDEARQRAESSSDSSIPLTVYHRQQLKANQWIPQSYENFTRFVSSSHLFDQCPQDYDEPLSTELHLYWKTKRTQKKNFPLIRRIDFVLEQRENAELLLAQVNYCLKIRRQIEQLENYSQSTLLIPSLSSCLNERLDYLKCRFSSSQSSKNVSPMIYSKKTSSSLNSKEYYQLIENSKHCIVALETTFRDGLELDTTYLIGETFEGETMLLPKQLMEQGNLITINETDQIMAEEQIEDENETPTSKRFQMENNLTYACHGNLVTCVTGSFD